MKILKEAKENLPIDFITSFVSRSWEEVGNIKSSIDGIKQTFKGTAEIEAILQDLADAYLIAIGQLESQLDKKKYINMPDNKDLDEALEYKSKEFTKIDDNNLSETSGEISAELPNFNVEIEQENNKLEIEIDPKNIDNDCEDKIGDFDKITNSTDKADFIVDFDDPEILSEEDSPYRQWMRRENKEYI